MATFLSILIPPVNGIVEGIDALTDEVWILGGEFCGIKACNDAEEGEITLNVLAPMVLAKAPAKDVVKLSLRLR
jgi:hypothetical protein